MGQPCHGVALSDAELSKLHNMYIDPYPPSNQSPGMATYRRLWAEYVDHLAASPSGDEAVRRYAFNRASKTFESDRGRVASMVGFQDWMASKAEATLIEKSLTRRLDSSVTGVKSARVFIHTCHT